MKIFLSNLKLLGRSTTATRKWLSWVMIAIFAIFATACSLALVVNIRALSQPTQALSEITARTGKTADQFKSLAAKINTFERAQAGSQIKVADPVKLEQQLALIQVEIQSRQLREARAHIGELNRQLDDYLARLTATNGINPPTNSQLNIPILIYHYTPPDFDTQIAGLLQRGYTGINLDQLDAALVHGAPLPPKPMVITFDDGFSNQLKAFQILQARHMPATFYIISSGELSKWCIGAARRYNDPLQPPAGCGDAYMNWNELKMLDRSGIITIGGHTIDHANLATLTPDEQHFEIFANKTDIESHLGHPITHFAYPYGSFDATSIRLVRQAGYSDAVSTLPGTSHSPDTLFFLHRAREAKNLP